MAKFGKFLWWFAFNVLVALCFLFSFGYTENWAQNVLKFYIWFNLIVTILAAIVFANSPLKIVIAKDLSNRVVPSWLNFTIDIPFTLILAANGWFGYASLFIFQSLLIEGLYQKSKEIMESKNDNNDGF